MGGLKVITPLLKHKKCKVRSLAARIISECCQNNPFCQELTVSDDVFSSLFEVAKNDEDHTARFHAFSAISGEFISLEIVTLSLYSKNDDGKKYW